MKNILLILCFLPALLFAQQEGFELTLDGGAQEYGTSFMEDNILTGWICAGTTNSFGAGGKDCYIVFVDVYGDTLFTNTYGTANDEVANSICDYDQPSKGAMRFFGGYQVNTNKDIYFQEIDYNGVTQYTPKTIDWGYGDDEITRLRYLSYASIYATGYITNQAGNMDMILLGLEDTYSAADTSFTSTFGGSGDEIGYDVAMDNKWGYPTMAGYSTSFGTGDQDVYIVSYDQWQPMVNWYKNYGGTGNDAAKVIIYDDLSYSFMVAGYTDSYGAGGKDIYVLKLNDMGDTIWTRTYGNILDDEPYEMVKYDTTYVISGYTTNPTTLDKDMYILTISALTGNIIDEKIIGDEYEDEIAYGIIQTSCLNYIIGDDNSDFYFSETDVIDLNISLTNITCNGFNDGAINIDPSGGSSLTLTSWYNAGSTLIASDTFLIDNLPAEAFILNFEDQARVCMFTDTFVIQEPLILEADSSVINASCGGACDGEVAIIPIGGIYPYTYNWSTGETDSLIFSVCSGTIDVTITDANGCQINHLVTIDESALGIINGLVNPTSYGTIQDDSATVYLLRSYGIGDTDTISITSLIGSSYQFTDVYPGTYMIKINVAEGLGYVNVVNSYHDSTFTWDLGTNIIIDCDSVINATTTLYEMTAMGSGNGVINGEIAYGNNSKAQGEPVPGAEVYIEQEPNDEPIASAQTDSSGYYEFIDIETGSSYKLFVDIPGYPLITTHTNIDINSIDTLYENLNFYVDTSSGSEGIYVDTPLGTEIKSLEAYYTIYPNPFSNKLNVQYNLEKDAVISLEMIDLKGNIVESMFENKKHIAGKYKYQFENISNGIYFIKLTINNNCFIKKVMAIK